MLPDDGGALRIQGAAVIALGADNMMGTYRPSARLVAANAALAHWLERHPIEKPAIRREAKKEPATIHQGRDGRRQSAAAPEEEMKPGEGGEK